MLHPCKGQVSWQDSMSYWKSLKIQENKTKLTLFQNLLRNYDCFWKMSCAFGEFSESQANPEVVVESSQRNPRKCLLYPWTNVGNLALEFLIGNRRFPGMWKHRLKKIWSQPCTTLFLGDYLGVKWVLNYSNHTPEDVNPETIKIVSSNPVPSPPKYGWGIHTTRYNKGTNSTQNAPCFSWNEGFSDIALHAGNSIVPWNGCWIIPQSLRNGVKIYL